MKKERGTGLIGLLRNRRRGLTLSVLLTLLWVCSVGVACLGMLGCRVFVNGPPADATVYVGPQEPEYIVVREAPPPRLVEQRSPPPSGFHIWVDGYWLWNGRYVWERGHWATPQREHAVWTAPRYERHGQGYRYTPGYWRVDKQEGNRGSAHGRDQGEGRGRQDAPGRSGHK